MNPNKKAKSAVSTKADNGSDRPSRDDEDRKHKVEVCETSASLNNMKSVQMRKKPRKTEEEKTAAKRAANRKSAFNCRQRMKNEVEELRKYISERFEKNNELVLKNKELTQELEKLEKENRIYEKYRNETPHNMEAAKSPGPTAAAVSQSSSNANSSNHVLDFPPKFELSSENLRLFSQLLSQQHQQQQHLQQQQLQLTWQQQQTIFEILKGLQQSVCNSNFQARNQVLQSYQQAPYCIQNDARLVHLSAAESLVATPHSLSSVPDSSITNYLPLNGGSFSFPFPFPES